MCCWTRHRDECALSMRVRPMGVKGEVRSSLSGAVRGPLYGCRWILSRFTLRLETSSPSTSTFDMTAKNTTGKKETWDFSACGLLAPPNTTDGILSGIHRLAPPQTPHLHFDIITHLHKPGGFECGLGQTRSDARALVLDGSETRR